MKLNVPFKSQWGAGANESRNDCGPTCLAMILAGYGIQKTVDEVFRATGATPDALINFDQMIRAGKACGLELTHHIISLAALKQRIENKLPAIALVNYRFFPNKQDTYNGAHFVVIFGQTPTKVIVHDPNRLSGNTYGDSVELTDAEFSKMWEQTNQEWGNRDNQVLVPTRPLNTTSETLTRREAIAAAYLGVYGRAPTKSELDRWDQSQQSIDVCIKELLDSLEYPKKIEELREKIERLEEITKSSDEIISGHLKRIDELESAVEKQKIKIKEEAVKLEATEKSAENALDELNAVTERAQECSRALVLAKSSNEDLIKRLANQDEDIKELKEETGYCFEAERFQEEWLTNSGWDWILEGLKRLTGGGTK